MLIVFVIAWISSKFLSMWVSVCILFESYNHSTPPENAKCFKVLRSVVLILVTLIDLAVYWWLSVLQGKALAWRYFFCTLWCSGYTLSLYRAHTLPILDLYNCSLGCGTYCICIWRSTGSQVVKLPLASKKISGSLTSTSRFQEIMYSWRNFTLGYPSYPCTSILPGNLVFLEF